MRRLVFWGATIGYLAGMLVTLIGTIPPCYGPAAWRTALVHWGMVVAAVGAGIGGVMRRGAANG